MCWCFPRLSVLPRFGIFLIHFFKLRFKVKPKSVFLSKDFKDCHMLAGLFQKMLHKADADATASASSASDLEGRERSNDRIGLEDFQRLVGTYEFRSYLQTRGTFDFWCV